MLPRAAARAVRQRSALPTSQPGLSIPTQWRRQYARSERPRAPPKPQPEKPIIRGSEDGTQGPVKNKTWSPDMGIKFAAPPPSTPQQQGHVLEDEVIDTAPQFARDPAQDLKSDFMPQSNAPSQQIATSQPAGPTIISQPPPTTKPTTPSSDAKLRHATEPAPDSASSSQPLPDLRQGLPPSGLFTDKASEPAASTSQPQETQTTSPLPDLRQGIPSSFGEDASTTGPQNPSLNLTEDPALGGRKRSEGDERSRAEYVSSVDRRRNMVANYMYLAFGTFATVGALILGRGWDQDEALLHPDAPNGWTPGAVYGRIKQRLGGQLGYYTEPAFQKLLPDMDPQMRAPYTLVLSLEDLLVSSKWDRNKGWQVAKRPGVDYFLRYLSQYYELVIFTSVASMNADPIIRKLDPFRIVSWPLFREATRYKDGEHVKDLSYLNRDLSKTIVVDTHAPHVQLQPENAIVLPKWSGDRADPGTNDLVALIPFLEYIAGMAIEDVRKVIKSYEGTHIPTEFHRRETLAREDFNKRLAEEKKRTRPSAVGGLASMLGMKSQPQMVGPSVSEGFAQGKMLSDLMREQGVQQYQVLEKEIRENGEKWLKEMADEEKKAQEEQMKSMQGGMLGFFGGGSPPPAGSPSST